MLDVQRAIRTVRANAKELGVNRTASALGLLGRRTLAIDGRDAFDAGKPDSRPDRTGQLPAGLRHSGLPRYQAGRRGDARRFRRNLLGAEPDPKLVELLSNDKQVTKDTPPTFLFHTDDDKAVPSMNSVLFYEALKRNKVPAELHIYVHGRHGVGLALNDPVLSNWPKQLEAWMRGRRAAEVGWVEEPKATKAHQLDRIGGPSSPSAPRPTLQNHNAR